MTDIRPDTDGDEQMTGDEHYHLELARFEIAQNFTDYTNADLLAALRVGYALGVADGRARRALEKRRLAPPDQRAPEDYPRPTKPERIMDDSAFHGWWTSSCPVCGKTSREYSELKARAKIVGHIMGAHAQWAKRAKPAKDET